MVLVQVFILVSSTNVSFGFHYTYNFELGKMCPRDFFEALIKPYSHEDLKSMCKSYETIKKIYGIDDSVSSGFLGVKSANACRDCFSKFSFTYFYVEKMRLFFKFLIDFLDRISSHVAESDKMQLNKVNLMRSEPVVSNCDLLNVYICCSFFQSFGSLCEDIENFLIEENNRDLLGIFSEIQNCFDENFIPLINETKINSSNLASLTHPQHAENVVGNFLFSVGQQKDLYPNQSCMQVLICSINNLFNVLLDVFKLNFCIEEFTLKNIFWIEEFTLEKLGRREYFDISGIKFTGSKSMIKKIFNSGEIQDNLRDFLDVITYRKSKNKYFVHCIDNLKLDFSVELFESFFRNKVDKIVVVMYDFQFPFFEYFFKKFIEENFTRVNENLFFNDLFFVFIPG